jgi:hypothetical protein
MRKEAESRNENLSEADRSKNLQWLVVGASGEKHLVKSTPREPAGEEREWRGRRGSIRGRTIQGGTIQGSGTQRGRGSGSGRGSRVVPMGPRTSTTPAPDQREINQTEISETEESEEMEEDNSGVAERRKRKERNEDNGAVGRPVKH